MSKIIANSSFLFLDMILLLSIIELTLTFPEISGCLVLVIVLEIVINLLNKG